MTSRYLQSIGKRGENGAASRRNMAISSTYILLISAKTGSVRRASL
jgi:hypothetical protein